MSALVERFHFREFPDGDNIFVRESDYLTLQSRLEAVEAERDDALSHVEELETNAEVISTEFEKDCWKAMRRLLDVCHFPWRDIDCGEGISADDAEEHIKTTLDEIEKDAARQRTRAEAAEARVEELQKALEALAASEEKAWGYDDDLRKGVGMPTIGQQFAANLRALLSHPDPSKGGEE